MVQVGNIWSVSCVFSVVNRPSLDSKPAVKVVAGGTQWDGNFLWIRKGKAAVVVWANHPPENLIILPLKNGPQKKNLETIIIVWSLCYFSRVFFRGVILKLTFLLRFHFRMMLNLASAAMGIPAREDTWEFPVIRWQPWKKQYLRGARAPQRPQFFEGMWRVVFLPQLGFLGGDFLHLYLQGFL